MKKKFKTKKVNPKKIFEEILLNDISVTKD